MYRELEIDKIIHTIEIIRERILVRFPKSGLGKVSGDLLKIAIDTKNRLYYVSKPNILILTGVIFLIVMAIFGIVATIGEFRIPDKVFNFFDLIQILESGINDIILIGAGIFFLVTIETRIRRKKALKAIHELRSIAHVIDMHQLTKDPALMLSRGNVTNVSPVRKMTSFELNRYLDYCSEMFSLIGKIAALYVQRFDDSVALAAVTEVENLTTGFSRKVWQKIMILDSRKLYEKKNSEKN
jgi:hypothetical protein